MRFLAVRNDRGGLSTGRLMRLLAGLLFALIVATLAWAQRQGDAVKPIPAWCGGSYSITGGLEPEDYVEALKAGVPLSTGTNFESCDDNAYSATPSSPVVLSSDACVVDQNGGVDNDGKAIVVRLTPAGDPVGS